MHALGFDDFDLWNHSNQTKTDHQQRSIPLNMTFLALSGKRSWESDMLASVSSEKWL